MAPRGAARDLLRLRLYFRGSGHAGQQRTPVIDGDVEIGLQRRVRLDPRILDVRLDREVVNAAADTPFLVGGITRAPGAGKAADDCRRTAAEPHRQHHCQAQKKSGTEIRH